MAGRALFIAPISIKPTSNTIGAPIIYTFIGFNLRANCRITRLQKHSRIKSRTAGEIGPVFPANEFSSRDKVLEVLGEKWKVVSNGGFPSTLFSTDVITNLDDDSYFGLAVVRVSSSRAVESRKRL